MGPIDDARRKRQREFKDRQQRKKLIQYVEPFYTSEPEVPEVITRECVFCHWIGFDKSTLFDSKGKPARNFRNVPTHRHKDDYICHLCDTRYIPLAVSRGT